MQMEGRVGEAVRSYQAALAKDPHHSPAALALGTLLAQPGTHQEPSLAEVCHGPPLPVAHLAQSPLCWPRKPDRLGLKWCLGKLCAVCCLLL